MYIESKLNSAGSNISIFTSNALEAIINVSNGTPRIIDKICNQCLLIGDNKKYDDINNDIVMMSVDELELG